jgi:hypothetical protein
VVRFSEIAASDPGWQMEAGRVFRIGYYSQQDGLDCVWLVNETGEYERTTDQKDIGISFEVIKRSVETDMFGYNKEPLGPVITPSLLASETV